MAITVPREDLEFIRDVDRLADEKANVLEIAREKGVVHSTIGYRLMRHGLKTKTTVQIVDIRTGKTFRELDAAGEFIVADEAPVLAKAA